MTTEKKVKLIWDFRGPDALRTAEHHAHHLKGFENAPAQNSGYEPISSDHCIAYLIVREGEVQRLRKLLKPHRGQYYQE